MADLYNEKEKKLIEALRGLKAREADFSFLRSLRALLLEAYDNAARGHIERPIVIRFMGPLRVMASSFAVLALLLSTAGGVAWASQKSLPTDFLYPVKLATEKTKLALTSDQLSRAKLHFEFAEKRLQEADAIGTKEALDQKAAAQTIKRFEDEVANLHREIGNIPDKGDRKALFNSLYAIEQKMNKGLVALEEFGEKVKGTDATSTEITHAIERAQNTAELGLVRMEDRIFDLQRKTSHVNGEDQRQGARFARAVARAEMRLNELEAKFSDARSEKLQMLQHALPTKAIEPEEIPLSEDETKAAEKLGEARKLLDLIKASSSGDKAQYLGLLGRLQSLEDQLALIEAELEK